MHIMEGFLPIEHAIGWAITSVPFVAYGISSIKKQIEDNPEQRMLLGVAAAFSFVLSALKLPSVTGSCSHPTGTGLGAILFGPAAMAHLLRHPALDIVAFYLETPDMENGYDAVNVARLADLVADRPLTAGPAGKSQELERMVVAPHKPGAEGGI